MRFDRASQIDKLAGRNFCGSSVPDVGVRFGVFENMKEGNTVKSGDFDYFDYAGGEA